MTTITKSELITEEDDVVLRGYARRLDSQIGEDAYHNAVCDILHNKTEARNIIALCSVATKRSLYKLFRHECAERKNIEHYIHGDAPRQVALQYGRQKQLKCRKKLHDMVEGNLAYVGLRRTCKACMEERIRKKHNDKMGVRDNHYGVVGSNNDNH